MSEQLTKRARKLYFSDRDNTARNAVLYLPLDAMVSQRGLELALRMELDAEVVVEIRTNVTTLARSEREVGAL
jgi:hypothetical protein